jgi:hypothetical protein
MTTENAAPLSALTMAEALERGAVTPAALLVDALARVARVRASPSKTIKRHGASLPWSGVRTASVSNVSCSAASGAGPVMVRGGAERRRAISSRAAFWVLASSRMVCS